MLLKITATCALACTHCLEDARPNTGLHMTRETFTAALECTRRVEGLARQVTGYNLLLFSGGECTEHPDILTLLDEAIAAGFAPVLITNGMWLAEAELSNAILARPVMVQVTNDVRFYPRAPPRVEHPKVVYVDRISVFTRLGRGAKTSTRGVPLRQAPSSFNLRSLTRSFGDIRRALVEHRRRALTNPNAGGHCTPTISHDGAFVVGESRFCAEVGSVHSTPEELTRGILAMGSCDRCGLERNLPATHRQAIGLPT